MQNIKEYQTCEPSTIRDSDLIIDLECDVQSGDNKTYKCNEYEDIEKLIEVSKQFQADYENEKFHLSFEDPTDLHIPILSSGSNSYRPQKISPDVKTTNDIDNYYFSNRSFEKTNVHGMRRRTQVLAVKLPNAGPFGTGIVRPAPKKHSCVTKSEISPSQRSNPMRGNIKPYTSRYYNFDRLHPTLQLVENGDSIFPKRIRKGTAEMAYKVETRKGLTWHEFFERSNNFAGKTHESWCGGVRAHTTSSTQTNVAEAWTVESNDVNKIQKHVLPPMNIRAECSIQRIPEISIVPTGLKHTVKSNIKMVEIVYENASRHQEREEQVQQGREGESKLGTDLPNQSESSSESPNLSETNESTDESSETLPSSSNHHGYDSSLDESISLIISRASALTSGVTNNESAKHFLHDKSTQTQKLKKFLKNRRNIKGQRTMQTSSDCSEHESDEKMPVPTPPPPSQIMRQEVSLPTFPTNELLQMVDEIFDTSNEVVNVNRNYILKETSVQTEIVWENINELLRQQSAVLKTTLVGDPNPAKPFPLSSLTMNGRINGSENGEHFAQELNGSIAESCCRHVQPKKFKICSCVPCNSHIVSCRNNVEQKPLSSASGHTSTSPEPIPVTKTKIFPSERFKKMKQAQREHFENDPRISKTLKKIYETAKTMKSSSSSSEHRLSNYSQFDNELLEPSLYTINDEALLFGLNSKNEIHYSSHLLRTESSQDTSTQNGNYYGRGRKGIELSNKLLCTNSEESSYDSFNKRESDLERCLMKDIENSWSDPAALSSVFSSSSLERKVYEIQSGGGLT
ncbi:hypothetical protein Bhyg_14186 [Pseudolycoriella hygida]|uniref:Uncharacterized protein n=1 Tax=Pseudolycoriella hygida TaxID=35572 RepID=A0A9Q0MP92_9DIPT|nr:hypothetical protein Bhyg_14186 [Pseudolycoriella hygida]